MKNLIFQWLITLSDPSGLQSSLPADPLPKDTFAKLCRCGEKHGVLPALISNTISFLSQNNADRLSKGRLIELQSELKTAEERLHRKVAFSMILRRQSDEIMQILHNHSIPAVVLKGQNFANRLYQPSFLRCSTDVDILIPYKNLNQIDSIMERSGYKRKNSKQKYTEGYGQIAWQPIHKIMGTVEFHWNIVNSPTVRRGVSLTYEDLQFEHTDPQILTSSAMLLVAAVHAATSHAFDRLMLLWDICQLCREMAGPLDVGYLSHIAKQTGTDKSLAIALYLGYKLLKVSACKCLAEELQLKSYPIMRLIISPNLVLRQKDGFDALRRILFRELLKR